MSDYGIVTETGTVRFERLLPGPIERVWSYLTESDKRGTWLAPGPMGLRVGGRVELNFHHADLTPHRCRVSSIHPCMNGESKWTSTTSRKAEKLRE